MSHDDTIKDIQVNPAKYDAEHAGFDPPPSAKLIESRTPKQMTVFADSPRASGTHAFSQNRAWPEDIGQHSWRRARSRIGFLAKVASQAGDSHGRHRSLPILTS